MPSVTRPLPWSGCGRRSLSNRRTSVSSAASRYTTRALAPRAPRSLMADFRSVLNARLRTSTTAAIRLTAPLDLAARSTIVGSRPGGRLSTTNQPRSSRDLAAVDRPAPDRPVMMTMSAVSSAVLIVFPRLVGARCLIGTECRRDRRGQPRADAGHGRDLLDAGRGELADRAEVLEQRLAPGRAEPGYVVERAAGGGLAALLPVVGDGEPVGLVPDPLEQVEPFAAARQDDRVLLARRPDFLQALGQAADGDVVDAELGQGPRGGVGLERAAVHDDQVRRVGELILGVEPTPFVRKILILIFRVGVAEHVELARLLPFGQVPAEPPGDHLVDRGDVVGAAGALDREPAVLALARQAILEHDHRRDHVRALEVRHVVALDPQRRVVQAQRLLDLAERLAPGGEVAGPPGLVQRERLAGVPGHGLQQGLLVTAARHPQADRAAAAAGQPLGHGVRVRRQLGHQDLARDAGVDRLGPRRGVRVDLAEELLHQARRGDLLDLVQDPAALPADPAAAHVEDLDGRLELVLGQRDNVAVGAVAEHYRLLLDRALQGPQVVAEPGGALELLLPRGLPHLGLEPPGEPAGLPGHEVAEVLGQPPVLLGADPLHARRRALADVAEQARAADLA